MHNVNSLRCIYLLHTRPYLRVGRLRDQTIPQNSHLRNFQHYFSISLQFFPLSVTILSRSIAFSFHLKRSVSVTLKKCWKGVCGRGSAPDPPGGAHDVPSYPIVAGERDTPPNSYPLNAFSVSISVNPL